jgi:hypothetical protein
MVDTKIFPISIKFPYNWYCFVKRHVWLKEYIGEESVAWTWRLFWYHNPKQIPSKEESYHVYYFKNEKDAAMFCLMFAGD